MNGLWGQGLMALAKVIVVLDRDVDVQRPDEAWWVALNNIDPQRDVAVHDGTGGRPRPLEPRVHLRQSKMGIDATRKWPEEGFTREWPGRIEMDQATRAAVNEKWARLGIRLP